MDKKLFFLMGKAHKKLFRHLDVGCQDKLDISLTQLGALLFIAREPGCQQKAVADALDLNKSAITGLLARMELNGLIARQIDADDARAVSVFATALGQQKVLQAKPLIAELNHLLEQRFSEVEIDTILRFFHFIIERFK